ncbi:hypothetical protein DPEC_G00331820 [Dallia pectoralis]|uniref:Uncharacterized protein n=1 Tax=Dallia pectoralis TaxID=75939 RepID=A0ACC2F627_DALPE|nr:hypothetical protein DPEC_G00331820 [Dallia pectoralis]
MVRKPQSPCSQVVKRILERGTTPVPRVEGLGLRREHVNGPLPAMFPNAVQYSVYKTEQFTLKLDRANCYVSIEVSVRRKLAHPPTHRLTPAVHPTSSYSEETAVIIREEASGLEDCRTEGFPDLNEDLHLTELTTINWQQEAEYEGLGSPELSVNTNMPQCRETPLPRPGLPHRTPQSQRFARSAPAGCTAVERLLLEQVGELQLKMDYVIKLLQKNNSVPEENVNLNMLPLLTLQDLENFDDQLRADSTFKKKVITKLSLSGGKNLKETVWRVCTKIFDQNLSTQLNWCGRGQKTGLKSRPIHQVLLSAVLRNPAQPNSTEADVEMTVRNWLRLSRDRNGGRQRRGEQAS